MLHLRYRRYAPDVECTTLTVKLNSNLPLLKSHLCGYSDTYILVNGTIADTAQVEDNPITLIKK